MKPKRSNELAQVLSREFERRQKRNPQYSLRSFARDMSVPPSSLSLILTNQRSVSRTMMARIVSGAGPQSTLAQSFLKFSKDTQGSKAIEAKRFLPADEFAVIADWQHYAILNLIGTADFRFDYDWIAERLGLSPALVILSVERLLKMGLAVVSDDSQSLHRASPPLETTSDIVSKALRVSHRQNLQQAMDCLDLVDLEHREIMSTTFVCDPRRIKVAKLRLRKFRDALSDYLAGGNKTEVYNLNMQLVPVTKVRSKVSKRDKCHAL